jgi:adenylate cyclase
MTALWSMALAVCSVLLVSGVAALGMLQPLEWMSYDARVRLFNSDKPAPQEIAVVLIDEASLRSLNHDAGRWPWPRSVHADLLDFLARGKPRAVVFDILFVENQRDVDGTDLIHKHDQRLIDATRESGFSYHAMQLLTEPADDSHDTAQNQRGADDPRAGFPPPRIEPMRWESARGGDDAPTGLPAKPLPAAFIERWSLQRHMNIDRASTAPASASQYNAFELPIDGLWQAARGVGVVRAEPDRDGRYRRMPLLHAFGNDVFPSLALAPVLDTLHPTTLQVNAETLSLDTRRIPLDHNGQLLINQYGKFNAYSYSGLIASLKQLNDGDIEHLLVSPDEFTDRIVFVGADAVGVHDLKATALSAKTAGVYLQASVAGNLLREDYLRPVSDSAAWSLRAALALLGAVAALALRQITVKIALLLVLLLAFGSGAVAAFRTGLVVDMLEPMLSACCAWFAAFSFLFFTEGKDKRRVRRVLAQYVSPAVLAEVVDKYENYLGAEIGLRANITVLFSDIRNFTSLSETLSPEKVVEMLNVYFSAMTDVLFAHQATIDKFIGDAIMAFWGAPVRDAQHAVRAVRAALDMLQALNDVNTLLAARGFAPISFGIGINSGEAVLGNIGSEKKLAYTAIGDNVNLAARLEGLTKLYGCPVLITENTFTQVTAEFPCRLIDSVRVKGKTHAIRIFAPLAHTSSAELATAHALCETTARAFACYQQRQWCDARALYAALPADHLRELFVARCHEYELIPPAADWDGSYTLSSK